MQHLKAKTTQRDVNRMMHPVFALVAGSAFGSSRHLATALLVCNCLHPHFPITPCATPPCPPPPLTHQRALVEHLL